MDGPVQPSISAQQPLFLQLHDPHSAQLATELADGLLADTACISPKFFYDSLGSRLFNAITCLPEYAATRAETTLLLNARDDIAMEVGLGCTLIDLGAGDCAKAALLFDALRPSHYIAVDISVDHLQASVAALQRQHTTIDMIGLGLDFSTRFTLPNGIAGSRRLVFYPGSSIGNFVPSEALRFLRDVRTCCASGLGLLIGFDLAKDKARLDAAYDDALRVTAAFNRNVLLHANRLLNADFDLRDWKHVAFYAPERMRVEMHLEARRDLEVRWGAGKGMVRRFARGERIHTENSYKYRLDDARELLFEAGFGALRVWTDDEAAYALILARPMQ
ncbi:MAG TPA: L-histidine N(alpha)-methyltransferase [Burkholderiaceae bacterium]|nr:L-histidine N(alpha)-methyltransferase [Burkholderiaceae bacterium]